MMKLLLLLFGILYVCSAEECQGERLVEDPDNVHNYKQCVHGEYMIRPCAPGTQFSEADQACSIHAGQSTGDITGYVTCDNDMTFYVDGVFKVYKANDWFRASSVTFPDTARSVAIKCFDRGVIAGIKAAFDNDVRTDGSWKCSNTFQEGWNAWDFDDSSWEDATIQTHTAWGNSPTELNDGVTKWIWTKGDRQDRTVYCRKRFNTGSDSCDASSSRLVTDPNNCKSYKQCVHGEFVIRPCAPGTGFSETLQTCDHLFNLLNCN